MKRHHALLPFANFSNLVVVGSLSDVITNSKLERLPLIVLAGGDDTWGVQQLQLLAQLQEGDTRRNEHKDSIVKEGVVPRRS